MDIVLILGILLAFAVLAYILLDGFDLGVGILFPFAPTQNCRNVMMSSIAPVWDGNETWLIFGGGVLFAAFPLAYSILLPALYIPLMVMIFALIFRGVAFEFRLKAEKSRWVWDLSFAFGSTLAAFCQGIILGALIEGFKIENGRFVGSSFDFTSSFGIITGFAMVAGYALLGSTWLIMKTEGITFKWAKNISKTLAFALLGFILMISMAMPLEYPKIAAKWFTMPNFLYVAFVPILTIYLSYKLFSALNRKTNKTPFACTVGLFILSFIGIGISFYPNIILPNTTIWDAAAPKSSLDFLSVIVVICLPIIIAYSIFVYKLFKGKVAKEHVYY